MHRNLMRAKRIQNNAGETVQLYYYLLVDDSDSLSWYGVHVSMRGKIEGDCSVPRISHDCGSVWSLLELLAREMVTPGGLKDTLYDLIEQWRDQLLK